MDQFQDKLKQIKQSPYQLRRMMGKWPYYETLKKTIHGLQDIEIAQLQLEYPILVTESNGHTASPQVPSEHKLIF